MALRLSVDRESDTPVYQQLRNQIRALILEGELPPGCRLPSERDLARDLGLNRGTVVNAYRELAADGLLEGQVGRGTIVLGPAAERLEEPDPAVPLGWSGLIRTGWRRSHAPLLHRVAEIAARPGAISFASGAPAVEGSPHLHLAEVAQRVLAGSPQAMLDDSPTGGVADLRAALAQRLALRGCRVASGQIMILSGSQQGLYLVSRLLLEPGDVVLVETPTYLGALDVFRGVGAHLIGVPMDEEGMRVDAAERVLVRGRTKLIYTIPNFQNPTGATMSPPRRQALLALARQHQVPILEDDLYGELHYDSPPPLPIKSLDGGDYVVYLGSLSPVLGPGLRLGWLAAPPAVVEPLTALRQTIDLHPSGFLQGVVREMLADGSYEAHLEWMRLRFGARREAMLASLQRHMPQDVSWQAPGGGFFVWCSLPPGLGGRELLEEAAGEGVALVPGEVFFSGGGEGYIRLNFSCAPEGDIEEGVRRLARAVKRQRGRERQGPVPQGMDRPVV